MALIQTWIGFDQTRPIDGRFRPMGLDSTDLVFASADSEFISSESVPVSNKVAMASTNIELVWSEVCTLACFV